jgi:Fe-S cluster biosynthesis and repair protein YggX
MWTGAIGEAIRTRICASCWEAWEAFSVKLVNEYGLSMGNREHYETYVKHLKEFLELETPPKE